MVKGEVQGTHASYKSDDCPGDVHRREDSDIQGMRDCDRLRDCNPPSLVIIMTILCMMRILGMVTFLGMVVLGSRPSLDENVDSPRDGDPSLDDDQIAIRYSYYCSYLMSDLDGERP